MSKLYVVLAAAIVLSSCKQKTFNDPRPLGQINMLKQFQPLDDSITNSKNDLILEERLEQSREKIKAFVEDSLNNEFVNWKAEVQEIESGPLWVTFSVIMPLNYYDRSNNGLYSLVFKQNIPKSNNNIIEILKGLKVGDFIEISGNFDNVTTIKNTKELSDNLISPYSFRSPEIEVIFTQITKSNR